MEEKELKQEIQTVDEKVNAIIVNDKATFELAGEITIGLDSLIKKINAYWKDPIDKAFQAHKALTTKRKEMLEPVEDRKRILRQKISAYLTEQERIRREEQRKLDEERRKKEETERKRLEERAAKAEEKGKIEKAEVLREKAEEVYIPPTFVQPEIEKTTRTEAGTISLKKSIKVTIIDPLQIIQAIARGQGPITIVEIKESKLKQYIELQKATEFPGCEIEEIVDSQFRGKISA